MLTARAPTGMSLKNILITTDFSPASRTARPFALSFARMYGASLFEAHVVAPEARWQTLTERLPVQGDRSWHGAKEKLLAFTAPELGNAPCKSLLRRGDLDDIIPNLIQENEINLVVLGTHGLRGVPSW